jgi:hypothetical protein
MPAFVPHGDAVRMQLRDEEVDLLRRLRDELEAVLRSDDAEDAVRRRLFPPAVGEDPDADEELRRLMHDDLLQSRLTALEEVLGYLDRAERSRRRQVVDLVGEEPVLVLGVLNDLRLALGARVGHDLLASREPVDADDPRVPSLAVMDHLAMWQEQLLGVLDPVSTAHYDEDHGDPDA